MILALSALPGSMVADAAKIELSVMTGIRLARVAPVRVEIHVADLEARVLSGACVGGRIGRERGALVIKPLLLKSGL